MTAHEPIELGRTPRDGRAARSAKTRDAIADALLDLLVAGNLRPTAKEIAEAAGVSVRSVYVHFDDLEDLFAVAARRHFRRVLPILAPAPATGSLRDRAYALLDRRARLYSQLGAVGRATQLQAPFSPTLRRILHDAHDRSRAEIEAVFAPELDELGVGMRERTVAIVDTLAGPATWDALRDVHGQSVDATIAIAADAITAVVERAA